MIRSSRNPEDVTADWKLRELVGKALHIEMIEVDGKTARMNIFWKETEVDGREYWKHIHGILMQPEDTFSLVEE